MTGSTDLTRWNRAGLRRFRYVQGNAAEYLELWRLLLAERFPDWEAMRRAPVGGAEQPGDRLARVAAQYQEERGDWGWEIARSVARACHVLTEHLDADANEGFLGNATQWDNLRRLVEMLDYHPAPPASASTLLVLAAKPGLRGVVPAGLPVKYTPPAGGAPVVFETLYDADVDAELNELRWRGHDRSPAPVVGTELRLVEPVEDLRVGDPLVLESEDGFTEARLIAMVMTGEGGTTVTVSEPIAARLGFVSGRTWIHLKPGDRLLPVGPTMGDVAAERAETALQLKAPPHQLHPGDIVYVSDGRNEYFRRVTAVEGARVRFDGAVTPLNLRAAWVSHARKVPVADVAQRGTVTALRVPGDFSYLLDTTVAKGDSTYPVANAVYAPVDPQNPEGGGYTTLLVGGALVNPQTILVKPLTREFEVDSYLKNDVEAEQPFVHALTVEAPKKARAGDPVVVVSGKQYAWGTVANVTAARESGSAVLTVPAWRHRGGGRYYTLATQVFTAFKQRVRLSGWDRNDQPVTGSVLDLEAVPARMVKGRRVVVAAVVNGVVGAAKAATVTNVDERGRITLDLRLEDPRVVRSNLVVHGNVALAGHGERKPDKVLGSGDPTRSHQTFVLPVAGASFVGDPTQPSGVRADIDLLVGGEIWTQVGTLRDSAASDPHYVVRMTEDGFLLIRTGDGVRGRRLPGGSNNVRVRYRVGSGLAGNVPAGSFTKPAKPHPLVAALFQPFTATGGNDLEDAASMRQRAPATVLTLERAVSLADFANLAASHSSVWQARALRRVGTARVEVLEVVVVPADGGWLGELGASLETFLREHAVPHVEVIVSPYQSVPLALDVLLRVDTERFDPEAVQGTARQALLDAFSLRRRGIGQPLYLSEVYQVAEGVEGVASSRCVIGVAARTPLTGTEAVTGPGGDVRVLRAGDRQVIHLAAPALTLDYEPFVP